MSISGDVLIKNSTIGGAQAGEDVYNGVENFCINGSQKTVIQDSQIITGSDPRHPHGYGIAFLGVRAASLLVERSGIRNSAGGILFGDLGYNVIIRNNRFANNGNACFTSSLGLYPQFASDYGFGNFLLENNTFEHSGAALLAQFYGGTQTFNRLVLRGNTVTYGFLLGGGFNGPTGAPFAGFAADGNVLGAGAGDANYERKPRNGQSLVNFAVWTNTVRSDRISTSCEAINYYGALPANNTITNAPATDVTVVNDHPASAPVMYLTMNPAALPGYPAGFTTTYLNESKTRAWALKADATWNTFTSDQPIPEAGLTIRKNASGKFELAPGGAVIKGK